MCKEYKLDTIDEHHKIHTHNLEVQILIEQSDISTSTLEETTSTYSPSKL